jgi:hypothetical protein
MPKAFSSIQPLWIHFDLWFNSPFFSSSADPASSVMDQPTCSCDYQDTAYIARSCGSSLNVTLFMTLVDVMLRTQCDLADPCGRASSNLVRNRPLQEEYDFVVVGGGVAGKYKKAGV